jgi:hypothetical protein
VPEYVFGFVATALLGWGGFVWRRAEDALIAARENAEAVDKLEVKLAEQYVTKEEFRYAIDNVLSEFTRTRAEISHGFDVMRNYHKESYESMSKFLHRLEDKVDYHISEQTQESKELRNKLKKYEG